MGIIQLENVSKTFQTDGGVIEALKNVTLDIEAGDIYGIIGMSGAGKSTLIKIITGAYSSDEGDIYLDGQKVDIKSTFDARAKGISAVYQEFSLINTVSVAENIYMGKLLYNNLGPIPRADWKRMNEETQKILNSLGVKNIKPETIVGRLSVAQKQMVEIAKALSNDLKVLIMDEPTRGIDVGSKNQIYALINDLAKQGIGIIMISSEMEEIMGMSDRMLVMAEGRIVGELDREEFSQNQIMKYASNITD